MTELWVLRPFIVLVLLFAFVAFLGWTAQHMDDL